MKYYLGIDSSTSCTGIALIDENEKLIFYDHVYSKDKVKKSESLGKEFDIILDLYDSCFQKLAKTLYDKDPLAEVDMAIEANSFGGYNTTMLLGITIGLCHALSRKYLKIGDIKYSAVGNWRSKILGTDPEEDLSNNAKRNELKIKIMDWAERIFDFHLPLFIHEGDGIKSISGLYTDCRVNDISDAIGLAYCCKNGLLSDRRQLKIETKRADNKVRSLKNGFKTYRKKVEEWYKRWKKSGLKSDLKTLNEHIKTLETYASRLRQGGNLLPIMDNWLTKGLKEIKNEIQ